jgi:hypothetical protein
MKTRRPVESMNSTPLRSKNDCRLGKGLRQSDLELFGGRQVELTHQSDRATATDGGDDPIKVGVPSDQARSLIYVRRVSRSFLRVRLDLDQPIAISDLSLQLERHRGLLTKQTGLTVPGFG